MNNDGVRIAALAGLAVLIFGALACEATTQRVVEQGFQTQDDTVMFLYSETPGAERGLLECSVDGDGDLYDCKEMPLVFEYED